MEPWGEGAMFLFPCLSTNFLLNSVMTKETRNRHHCCCCVCGFKAVSLFYIFLLDHNPRERAVLSMGHGLLIVKSASWVKPQGTLASCSLPDQYPRKKRFKFVSQGIFFLGFNYSNYTHFPLYCTMKMKNLGTGWGTGCLFRPALPVKPTATSFSTNTSIASGTLKSPLRILCTFLLWREITAYSMHS